MTNANEINWMAIERYFRLEHIAKEVGRYGITTPELVGVEIDNAYSDMEAGQRLDRLINPCAKCGEAEAYMPWDPEGAYARYGMIALCFDCNKEYEELQKVDKLF